jgi:hypothetical protein
MITESFLPEDQIPSCVDHGPYDQMPMGALASLAVGGDEKAYAEFSRRVARGERQVDYDYELRHPGHGDQSVHNPHKGAGAGAFVPGKWQQQPELTIEQHRANTRATFIKGREDRFNNLSPEEAAKLDATMTELADMTYGDVTGFTTYKNGPVSLHIAKDAAAPLTPELQARMDTVIAGTQERYPGKMDYQWGNVDDGSGAQGVAHLGSRYVTFDSAKMTKNKDVPGGGFEHTVWHETGHALPMKGLDPSQIDLTDAVNALANDYSSQVIARLPELNRVFTTGQPYGMVSGYVSKYASKSPLEMHAEVFALFHNPLPNTGKFSQKVIDTYGEIAGWTK